MAEYGRGHIPKQKVTFSSYFLVSSDKRPYRNSAFHNVLALQGSSFAISSLNFQAFVLRDIKMAIREDCRVGQKMGYSLSFG